MEPGEEPTIRSETGSEPDNAIRRALEAHEDVWLHPAATRSAGSRRLRPEPESPIRTAFQRDRDRVTHSTAFRRLQRKTQVFITPEGDHYRTRLTHTLEVTQIARTVGRALRLNEDLIEAIGLAHDLGHTPFGHAGERALAEVYPGFRHNEQSLRVVERIEKDGQGLNLTEPVRDGIVHHSKPAGSITGSVSGDPATLEGEVIKLSDGIAYINHDLDDAIRAGVIDPERVPTEVTRMLGDRHSVRIDRLVSDLIEASRPRLDEPAQGGRIGFSESVRQAANLLRDFLFAEVYAPINRAEPTLQAQRVVRWLFTHYVDHPEQVPYEFRHPAQAEWPREESVERIAADYVASMTDRYALEQFEALYMPRFRTI